MHKFYDGRAAAAYALKYAINYNPAWSSYKGKGGDCTNFVSQALYTGGWTMITGGMGSRDHRLWYSDMGANGDHSWTWSNATSFYWFLTNNLGRRARRCSRDELAMGDIVQLQDYDIIHHTVIVTGVLPTSIRTKNVAFVTYHTNDVQQTLIDKIANKTGDNLICWKILSSYDDGEDEVRAPDYTD